MSVRKRPGSPYFMAELRDPKTGKRKRVSTRLSEKRAAERWAVDEQRKLGGEAQPGKPTITLKEALDTYVGHLESLKKPSARNEAALRDKCLGLNPRMVAA